MFVKTNVMLWQSNIRYMICEKIYLFCVLRMDLRSYRNKPLGQKQPIRSQDWILSAAIILVYVLLTPSLLLYVVPHNRDCHKCQG